MLTESHYDREHLVKLQLQGQSIEGVSFEYCLFERCDFSNIQFKNCHFLECRFHHSQLTLSAFPNARLQGVFFKDCKLVGIDFSLCQPKFLHIGFENAILDSCNFSHMVLNDTCWRQSQLKACIFNETHLQKADFSGARLTQTLFHHSSLQGANFRGASEYAINPLTNKLNKAKFSQPEVMSLLQYLDIIVESSPN